ncbi:hypothetical protein BS47DRAFT_928866 [Hydnum rufescens UP504]|uniref:Uncharacterized protein n=1 Tax=Hydnum rufescens UP504 TaxID=1448309 RepID=A0A9P6AXC9_9AGAM|nr:hypothetical protein BS47DRAFT_928866 [Hydnum rufescens UP504]
MYLRPDNTKQGWRYNSSFAFAPLQPPPLCPSNPVLSQARRLQAVCLQTTTHQYLSSRTQPPMSSTRPAYTTAPLSWSRRTNAASRRGVALAGHTTLQINLLRTIRIQPYEGSSWDSDGLAPTPNSGYRNSLSTVSSFCHPLCSHDHHSPLCRTRATGRDNTDPRMLFPYSSSPRSSRSRSASVSTTRVLPGPRKAIASRLTPSFMSALDSSSCLGGF